MNYRDKRLMRLIQKALLALEDPAKGIIFDDFDLRYCERERKREKDSAAWYYRDKLSFEQKYEAECDSDNNSEPAWVSDNGQGAKTHYAIVSHDLDGERKDPFWLVLFRRKRLELKPKHRKILDALALDWRSKAAARIAGVSHNTVKGAKKIFKVHFAQCYQAWKRDFAV